MGLFSSGGTKLPKWAKPFAQQGLAQAQGVFQQNQGNLTELSGMASDAFKSVAPGAYGGSPFVDNAQGAARAISNGFFLGSNPGQSTYDRMQGRPERAMPNFHSPITRPGPIGTTGPASTANDPSSGFLTNMATQFGNNPGDGFASAVAQGQYLNNQPSAGLYDDTIAGKYLDSGNPYLESIIGQSRNNVTRDTNRMFSARGMGTGLSSAFADVVGRGLADSENSLRYTNYEAERGRQMQAAGLSDAAFASERGRMDGMAGLLSENYNQDRARMLAAAQSLGGQFNAAEDRGLTRYSGDQDRSLARYSGDQDRGLARYSGDQDRGLARYTGDENRALDAARASDAARSNEVAQMLAALGLTDQLESAQYAGFGPTTDLLKTAATLPYIGLDSYQTALANLLGATKKTSGPGIGASMLAGAASGAGAAAASDRRLKQNIEKLGELDDGLGVYRFEYIDGARFGEGEQVGVMADEVAELRPWASGPLIDGKYGSVYYGRL